MGKLLRARDILLLTLAGIGDFAEEARDPMRLMGSAYENMYGFTPRRYKRHNFLQLVNRNLKTGNIEKIIKNGKTYLRLTSAGKNNIVRDFPILSITQKWNKKWVIVAFDIEERSKSVRDSLRKKLKSLGFGMFQESVWISPLPIGEDMREFIHSIGLSKNVFVMEIASFVLGDPKDLVRRVWNLEKLEGDCLELKTKIENLDQLIKKERDRVNKSEAEKSKPPTGMTLGKRGKTGTGKPRTHDLTVGALGLSLRAFSPNPRSPASLREAGRADERGIVVRGKTDRDIDEKDKTDMDKTDTRAYLNELSRKRRVLAREKLEFVVNLPPLSNELLPKTLRNI